KLAEQRAERAGELDRVAEIRYGKLVELEKELAAAQKKLESAAGGQRMLKEEVDEEDIARIVAKWTGIPVGRLLEGEVEKLVEMEERLRQRVVGQEEALARVANAIRRSRAGLADPRRPLGSFLFLGPTGVGKTELARALAEFLFDDERAMVRLDMSEYMEKHSVARMIGAPPGYVGYEEGGQLTEQVRRRPYAVVLFDEIEKAHPEVFNLLLQVLDDGRLTDGKGRTVDFKNTVLIMTSNIAGQTIFELSGAPEAGTQQRSELRQRVLEALQASFRPEFLNRVDDTIVFNSLGRAELDQIVELQFAHLRRLLAERRIEIELTQRARELLFREGYDPAYGARPLKRAIQRLIQDPLALKILNGEVLTGDRVVVDADAAKGAMKFGRAAVAVAAP
ncbi:MAG: AAA family ATPase, partial [Terriglobia bacterium]